MELRELDWALGELAVPPDSEDWDVWHATTKCPSVEADYWVFRPNDDYYGEILELGGCVWCAKYRHNLVEPLPE